MAQQVTMATQPFVLDFVVIPLKKKGYDAILGRGWLVKAKVNHNWKNTLSMEKDGRKYVIDLMNQAVTEELASDSESKDLNRWEWDSYEGRDNMEPNNEGVFELDGCSEDDICSLNGLFHWQMEDYELSQCNMLQIEEPEENRFLPVYREYTEGDAPLNEAPTHEFDMVKPIRYEEPSVKATKLNEEAAPKNILVGDDWNPVLKAVAFKIFMEYKDVFTWTYKDLKGVPPELCVHRIPLVPGVIPVRRRP